MSYIPDCRTDEFYNEKYLNRKDKEFVSGYDWAVEQTVDNFFDNLNMLENNELEPLLNKEIECDETYEMTWAHGNREDEKREIKTFAEYLRFKILEWCEMERDELITSMIDHMDEAEYKAIKEKADGGQVKGENR